MSSFLNERSGVGSKMLKILFVAFCFIACICDAFDTIAFVQKWPKCGKDTECPIKGKDNKKRKLVTKPFIFLTPIAEWKFRGIQKRVENYLVLGDNIML